MDTYLVTASSLNLRSAPKMADNIVGSLKRGSSVELLGSSKDGLWMQVQKGAKTGWVFAKYLAKKDESSPIVETEEFPWMSIAMSETEGSPGRRQQSTDRRVPEVHRPGRGVGRQGLDLLVLRVRELVRREGGLCGLELGMGALLVELGTKCFEATQRLYRHLSERDRWPRRVLCGRDGRRLSRARRQSVGRGLHRQVSKGAAARVPRAGVKTGVLRRRAGRTAHWLPVLESGRERRLRIRLCFRSGAAKRQRAARRPPAGRRRGRIGASAGSGRGAGSTRLLR